MFYTHTSHILYEFSALCRKVLSIFLSNIAFIAIKHSNTHTQKVTGNLIGLYRMEKRETDNNNKLLEKCDKNSTTMAWFGCVRIILLCLSGVERIAVWKREDNPWQMKHSSIESFRHDVSERRLAYIDKMGRQNGKLLSKTMRLIAFSIDERRRKSTASLYPSAFFLPAVVRPRFSSYFAAMRENYSISTLFMLNL